MQLPKFFNKQNPQFIDIFNQPRKNSFFKKLKQTLLPSFFIMGTGIVMGLLTYGGLSLLYHTFNFLNEEISHLSYSGYNSVADLLSAISYLTGVGFSIKSALAFKEHNENPNEVPLSNALTYAIVAGMLIALPSFLSVGSYTTFSNSRTPISLSQNVDSVNLIKPN